MAMFLSNRPMPKVLLKNSTRMSLHERFTYLRNNTMEASGSGNPVQRQRELQQQTARNRRIAMQMERRPAVMAALKLKKKSLRQRLGISGLNSTGLSGNKSGTSVKDRLSLGRRGFGGRPGGKGLNRSPMLQQNQGQLRRGRPRGRGQSSAVGGGRGRLSRSQSTQSLNSVGTKFGNRARSRSRSRSRVRTNSISNNNNSNNPRFRNQNRSQRGSRGGGNPRFIQQKQRGRRGGLNTSFRGRGGRGGRGRMDRGGLRGGRGGQRGLVRRQNTPVPTKEELDNQLDQYMANSRYGLDKAIDSYMKQASIPSTSSNSATPMEESWD